MDIIVLLKQVPATESVISIAGDGQHIQTENLKWVMNPYDEFAVEEALQIKQKQGGGSVTLLSVGADKTVEALRTGLAMGADKAILVKDPAAEEADGLGIARILSAVIKTLDCDLILAGQRAVDDDAYLVGPAVAERLGIPHIAMVIKEEVTDGAVRCTRTIDGGTLVQDVPLPALLTTQRGLNEPRYASLPGIMKAKKKPIDTRSLADIGLDAGAVAPKVKVTALKTPPERTGGRIIEGDSAQAKAAELVKVLHEEAKVI